MKILQIIHMYTDKQSPKINIKTQHLQFNNKVKKFKKDISSQVCVVRLPDIVTNSHRRFSQIFATFWILHQDLTLFWSPIADHLLSSK